MQWSDGCQAGSPSLGFSHGPINARKEKKILLVMLTAVTSGCPEATRLTVWPAAALQEAGATPPRGARWPGGQAVRRWDVSPPGLPELQGWPRTLALEPLSLHHPVFLPLPIGWSPETVKRLSGWV